MIVSAARLRDLKLRKHFIEEMERALSDKLPITARAYGEASALMKKFLETYDYEREDRMENLWITARNKLTT